MPSAVMSGVAIFIVMLSVVVPHQRVNLYQHCPNFAKKMAVTGPPLYLPLIGSESSIGSFVASAKGSLGKYNNCRYSKHSVGGGVGRVVAYRSMEFILVQCLRVRLRINWFGWLNRLSRKC